MTDLEKFGLDGNPDLTTVHFGNEEEWKALRTKGIGGSDAGAIMGINKYETPLKVYRKKVDGFEEDLSDNVNVKKGKLLEDVILTQFVDPKLSEMGYNFVQKPDFMIINNKYPWLRANLDGIARKPEGTIDDMLVIEIKFVSEFAEVNWNGPDYCGVPASYYAQVQHYMAVTGLKKAVLCALFDRTWEPVFYDIPRDDEFIEKMLKMTQAFYEYNMLMGIPPRANISLDKEAVVEKVKLAPEPTTPDSEMSELIRKYKTVTDTIKRAEKVKDNLETLIFDKYSKGFCPDDPALKVKYTIVKSQRFDSVRFKTDHEDLYKQYIVESESTRKTIK